MNPTETLKINGNKSVPATPEARIAELMKLSLKQKEAFIPPVGAELRMGPFIYQVKVTNVGQLRFSCSLSDVVIEGVNDTKSVIVSPHTGRVVGK